jgi:hypothetical protein
VGTDQTIASTDGSTPIKVIDPDVATKLPNFMFVWAIPQNIQLPEPLCRLNLFINESTTPIDYSSGVIIESTLVDVNTNPVANDIHTQKLGLGSMAEIISSSTILLGSALLSMFFTSWDMFSRRKRSLSAKTSFNRSFIHNEDYKANRLQSYSTKSSDDDGLTGKSVAQCGEPAEAVERLR